MTCDPIDQIKEIRANTRPPSAEAKMQARDAMLGAGRAQRHARIRRAAVVGAGALAVTALIATVVGLAVESVSRPESASAAAGELAKMASEQPMLLGQDDELWVIANYAVRYEWTQNLTQPRLDQLVADQRNVQVAANSNGHYACISPKQRQQLQRQLRELKRNSSGQATEGTTGPIPTVPCSKSDLRELFEKEQETLGRIKPIPVDVLPTTTVVASRTSDYHMWMNSIGEGGAGGSKSNNVIEYATPEQAKSARLLERSMIGGRYVDPSDAGGAELATLPIEVGHGKRAVGQLGDTLPELRKSLAAIKPIGSLGGAKYEAGSPVDLFAKSAGVASSPFATPTQRVAALKLIGSLPGVELMPGAKDAKGRVGIGFSHAIEGGRLELIFDRQSARLTGLTANITDPAAFTSNSWTGSGSRRVAVKPQFDRAKIEATYEPFEVSDVEPACSGGPCHSSRYLHDIRCDDGHLKSVPLKQHHCVKSNVANP